MKGGAYEIDPKTKKPKLIERTKDDIAEGKAVKASKGGKK